MDNEKIIKIILVFLLPFFLVKSNGLAISIVSTNTISQCINIDVYDIYSLTNDITATENCIVITANNVVLNCQNHKITGSGSGIGIDVSATGVTINNCEISNFKQAIYVRSNGNANIFYNKLQGNNWGIYILNSGGSIIKGNIITSNIISGIIISSFSSNTIYDNYFNNSNNVFSDSSNVWNTAKTLNSNIIGGPYLGGNYWHDYLGLDTDGDGLGNTNLPYNENGNILNGGDYLPLVDINPPKYSNIQGPTGSILYSPSATYIFNITWKDNIKVNTAILQLDGLLYNDAIKTYENQVLTPNKIEHTVTYSKNFTDLKVGNHAYKWFGTDINSNQNSTDLLSFFIKCDQASDCCPLYPEKWVFCLPSGTCLFSDAENSIQNYYCSPSTSTSTTQSTTTTSLTTSITTKPSSTTSTAQSTTTTSLTTSTTTKPSSTTSTAQSTTTTSLTTSTTSTSLTTSSTTTSVASTTTIYPDSTTTSTTTTGPSSTTTTTITSTSSSTTTTIGSEESSTTTTQSSGGGGGGGKMPYLTSISSTNIVVILAVLIIMGVIIFGVFKLLVKRR